MSRIALALGLAALCANALGFQEISPRVPTYIPPACRGKPLTAAPRAVAAQPSRELETNPPIAKADQLTLFDRLAKTIDDVYVYRDFNGLPWPGIVADVRASVERGLDTEAFYVEMERFVRKLGDRHSYFLSPVRAAAARVRLDGENNYVGIGALVRALPERKRGAVMAVFPDSTAEHAGLQQHDSLLAVDGLPMLVDGALQQRTRGPECSVAILTVQSPGQEPRDIPLVRYRVQAGAPIHARRVATTDGSRIGYIFLPSFFDVTLVDQVKTALNGFGPLDGLIIDNRMNSGGASRVLLPILGYFTSGTVGHLVSRLARRPLEITADPIGNSQKTPMVVLVSKDTVSFGEIFAGVLQDLARARIVGQRTAGRVETLHGYNAPDGSQAWIAQEQFVPINSRAGWKAGVTPDLEVFAEWDTFTFESDPGVAGAVNLLGHK
jgi:carboxyl-terminal processing protease